MPKMPNLFKYATKELSQDAVICWLMDWARQEKSDDPEREKLRRCGRELILDLLNSNKDRKPVELPEEIEIEICPQNKRIDVLARINAKHVLLIESKTRTKAHSNQLKRYYRHVANGNTDTDWGKVKPEDIYPVYFKTGNQSRADAERVESIIEKDPEARKDDPPILTDLQCYLPEGEDWEGFFRRMGYRVFHRKDFLCVLDRYKEINPILTDYHRYLEDWEAETNEGWKKGEPKSRAAWEGFFRCLEDKLKIEDDSEFANWGGVNNPSGGFFGFWWPVGMHELYLQIDSKKKLCFKVWAKGANKEEKKRLKCYWHDLAKDAGEGQVVRPKVMRIGNTMTVGIWKKDWMAFGENDLLDVEGTVANMKEAEKVLLSARALAKAQAP